MNSLSKILTKHEKSKQHTIAEFDFLNLGKTNILDIFKENHRLNEKKRPTQQDKNIRYTICIFRTVLMFGRLGLPFRGDDESQYSKNKSNFIELVNLQSYSSSILQEMLTERPNCFLSPVIQNGMTIINLYIVETIKKELNQSNFVSIIADEATDTLK